MTIDNNSTQDEFEDESLNTGSDRVFQNYMMPGLELYDAKVTINHWQLRDCIKPYSRDPSKLYYIFDHSIRSLDTDPETLPQNTNQSSPNENKLKYANRLCRRHSIYNNTTSYNETESPLHVNYRTPSKRVVEFNFKPRCFTELNGLTACGGLIGSDDKGFPQNWNRLSHDITSSSSPVPSPAQPINIASSGVLMDNSNYSNSAIWKGILSLYNENLDLSMSLILGQFINNCVTLHENATNNYNLYTCNNDSHIYQCNISNRDVQLLKRYSDLKFPLNNSALSHDGKTMLVSGDSNKFALYRQDELTDQFTLNYDPSLNWNMNGSHNNSNYRIKRQTRFNVPDSSEKLDSNIYTTAHGDHGFYNCFSENDLQFATLFQNGVCLVYDIRNTMEPLAEITSTRPHSHNGSFRVCRFSYGLDDLLFISEHQGRVHVVDTRNFDNHQVILIPDTIQTMNSSDQNKEHQPTVVNPTVFNTDSTDNNNGYNNRRSPHHRPLLPIDSDSPSSSTTDSTSSFFGTINNSTHHNHGNIPLSNSRRRFSAPSSTHEMDPWITQAMSLPVKYLEPQILPFPKVFDKSSITNNYNQNQYLAGTMGTVRRINHHPSMESSYSFDSSDELIGREDSHSTINIHDQNNPLEERNTFRIRRFSTTSNDEGTLQHEGDDNQDDFAIDPDISNADNINDPLLRFRNTLFNNPLQNDTGYIPRTSRHGGNSNNLNDYMNSNDDTFYSGPYGNNNTSSLYRAPMFNDHAVLDFSENELGDENNISGIDWIQDRNGSSLIIGTDYGIIKWNINSWARRSFSSYDFC